MSEETTVVPLQQPVPRAPLFEMVGPLSDLFAALSKAQGEFPEIVKDMTANAGSFKYDYADLALVLRMIRPALAANGLALINPLAGGTASGFSVRTMLTHSSGAYMSSTMIIPFQDDPQEFGIRCTYYRRYSDLAMVGIFPAKEDTDGKKQEVAPRSNQAPPKAAPKVQPVAAPAPPKAAVAAPAGPSPAGGGDVTKLEPVPRLVVAVPDAPISDDQNKEISALLHSKAWPDSAGKPFREKNPKTGADRWAIINSARANELCARVCSAGTNLANIDSHANAYALLQVLRDFPEMPQ